MAFYESYQIQSSVVGSFLNARCGSVIFPIETQVEYAGTAGSVVVVLRLQ